MAIQIVQIQRQRFVCGLFWQSLSRRHELRKEAVELAQKLSFDLMVLRLDRGVAAVGFANGGAGIQSGLPSLGVIVSKTIAQEGAFYEGRQQPAASWLGAFKLPDGRWAYFAVRDGTFLPNGEMVGTAEDVFDRLTSDYGLGGWNVVIGDGEIESLGFHNFYPRTIDDVLGRRRGRVSVPSNARLRLVKRRLSPLMLALIVGALACVVVGVLLWMQHVKRERELAQARAFAAARMRIAQGQADPGQPWLSQPRPARFAQACFAAYGNVAPGGWALDRFDCQGTAYTYVWSRGEANIALLLQTVPQAQLDLTGEKATFSGALPFARSIEGASAGVALDTELLEAKQVTARLLSRFQTLGLQLALTPEVVRQSPPVLPAVAARGPGMTAPPPWHRWTWHVALDGMSPTTFATLLVEPGVRIEKLTYRAAMWTADGVLYAK
ncbi:pilO family protein [Robbsia andropogonis]|uniref:PilO family protein n=1 Tax=Robbsia andropogonis TaxID=28092 RepID=A0A0F5JXW0_9BURK|nr:type 4b pilus protein PilO2 [Robbsia andropogonis]KKB62711.1 pilO family protein [Robbsia andropogonis]